MQLSSELIRTLISNPYLESIPSSTVNWYGSRMREVRVKISKNEIERGVERLATFESKRGPVCVPTSPSASKTSVRRSN
jgi:hypothetical protein